MKNSSYSKTMIKKVLKEKKLYALLIMAFIILVAGISILPPQLLKIIIDKYLVNKKADGLMVMGLLYLLSFVIIGALDFVKGLIITIMGQSIVRQIRSDMAKKSQRIKASYFTKNSGGMITSRFINDVENINSLFSNGIISMAIDCFKIVAIVISIWVFNIRLGIFVLLLIPIIGIITRAFRKRMFISQKDNLKELSKVNNHISESINNIMMIKSFSREKYMEGKYKEYLGANYRTMNKVNFYDACYSPIIQVITALSVAFIFYISVGDSNVLGISVGIMAASINLIMNLFSPIDNLGTELQSIQAGISGIESIDEFFRQEEDVRLEVHLDIDEMIKSGISLEFIDMCFSYDGHEEVLKNFNLRVKPKENLCFVGRTGVGKTTLFKLIVGILKPTSGSIRINGIDVYDISDRDRRALFGYVEQEFSFLKGDIEYQVTLGDSSISEKQVEDVMKFVGLHEYIKSLKEGYKTDADGGSMFSKGQKQLFSIARAIVKDAPILLLDEVTANLDSVTEEKVVEVLKKASKDKMILSISHRMSSVLNSDRVVLIENGVIKSVGAPDEIINNSSWLLNSSQLQTSVE